MSMVFCRGCGKQIHQTANACPHCGAPQGGSASSHSKTTLAIVCFFVGFLGIHRFMVGKVGTGILHFLTLGLFGFWTLVDFIMILLGKFKDKQGNLITA